MSRNKSIKLGLSELRSIVDAHDIFDKNTFNRKSEDEFITSVELITNRREVKKVLIKTLQTLDYNKETIGSVSRYYETTEKYFYKDDLKLISRDVVDYPAMKKYKNMFNHLSQ